MKLNYNVKDMEQKGSRQSKYSKILRQFVNSGAQIAEVQMNMAENANSVYTTLHAAAKQHGLPVKISKRSGHIYLLLVTGHAE